MSEKSEWIKIFQHGCKNEPVRGYVREEHIAGALGLFYTTKATIIGHREMDIEECTENMASRVRFWELYLYCDETTDVQTPPEPYETKQEWFETLDGVDEEKMYNAYFQYYYENIGRFIGIVDTKRKACYMAEKLINQRRKWVEERIKALDNIPDVIGLSVDGLDDLPFD